MEIKDQVIDAFFNDDVFKLKELIISYQFDLETKFERGRTLLHMAAFYKRAEIIKMLLNMGSDVNAVNLNGTTPLMYLKTEISEDQLFLLNLIIERGADINQRDKFGKTALDYGIEQDNTIFVKYIKENHVR